MRKSENIDDVDWNKINEILKPTLDKMEKYKLYNIKNGCFSNKFEFRTCTTDKKHLAENLWKINYVSSLYDTGGYTELVVRELIDYDRANEVTIYEGMPLRTEVRVFYNMDTRKIEYMVDYWDFDYCYKNLHSKTDKVIFEYFTQANKQSLKETKKYIEKNINTLEFEDLKGIWSIDFMRKYNDIYLIDMARGFRSAYWDENKKAGKQII